MPTSAPVYEDVSSPPSTLPLITRFPMYASDVIPNKPVATVLLYFVPLAFCVIELVFDEKGHGVDFVFRYCNEMMADVEGIPISEMINRSFYEVFENGDKKWLVTYADVALNGNKHTLTDYSPEIDKHLTIYCYQPIPGYCACILIPK
jgi:hypothetical protein